MAASLVEGSQLCGRQVWIRLVADISFLNNQLAMDGPLLPAWYGIRYADRWPSRGHPRSVWGKEAVPPCVLACHRGSRRRPFRPLHPLLHPSKSPLQRLFIRSSACNVGASGRPADMSLGFDGNTAREEAGRLEMMSFASSSGSGPGYRRYKGMGCVVLNRGGVNLESRGARRERGWLARKSIDSLGEEDEAPGEEVLLTQGREMSRRLADLERFAWSLACCGRFLGSAAAQKRSGWKVVKMRNPTAPNQGGFQNPQGCVSGDRRPGGAVSAFLSCEPAGRQGQGRRPVWRGPFHPGGSVARRLNE